MHRRRHSVLPGLGHPNFSKGFILETDASLNGLGTILSQQGKDGKPHVIAYASHSICPPERSMCNSSSAKLELLALKWAVTEKVWDYLLGSWLQGYTDNNLLPTYKIVSKMHHKSDGLVSWHCLILPSSTKQAILTRLQMQQTIAHLTPPAILRVRQIVM